MLAGFPAAIDMHIRPPILSAEVFAGNPASLALLRRNGFAVSWRADAERGRAAVIRARPCP